MLFAMRIVDWTSETMSQPQLNISHHKSCCGHGNRNPKKAVNYLNILMPSFHNGFSRVFLMVSSFGHFCEPADSFRETAGTPAHVVTFDNVLLHVHHLLLLKTFVDSGQISSPRRDLNCGVKYTEEGLRYLGTMSFSDRLRGSRVHWLLPILPQLSSLLRDPGDVAVDMTKTLPTDKDVSTKAIMQTGKADSKT